MKRGIAGVVAINSPLKLRDAKSRFVPALAWWNRLMEKYDSMRVDYIENESENPLVNYTRNYINGVNELGHLIDEVDQVLPRIEAPALLVQAHQDPVVDPVSAAMIQERMELSDARVERLKFNRHIIVKGEGSEKVYACIDNFMKKGLRLRNSETLA